PSGPRIFPYPTRSGSPPAPPPAAEAPGLARTWSGVRGEAPVATARPSDGRCTVSAAAPVRGDALPFTRPARPFSLSARLRRGRSDRPSSSESVSVVAVVLLPAPSRAVSGLLAPSSAAPVPRADVDDDDDDWAERASGLGTAGDAASGGTGASMPSGRLGRFCRM